MAIYGAIEKARGFIILQRNSEGLWRDFNTQHHGDGVDWVSAYIGLALLNGGVARSYLELTADSLSKRQNKDGGWGYNNETSAPDADSTAFSMLFLSRFGYKKEVGRAKEFLLQHQRNNGGFGTYIEELVRQDFKGRISPGTSVDGWCSAISGVTAIALQAIRDNKRAVEYMKQSQEVGGFWRSYWYGSDVYATVQGIKALQNHGAENEIKGAQEWLTGQNPEIPFYLALQIRGLARSKKYREKTKAKISKLLSLQKGDGGWGTYPLLRVPSFSNLRPWEDSERKRGNIRDQNRVFTTATCLETLSEFRE